MSPTNVAESLGKLQIADNIKSRKPGPTESWEDEVDAAADENEDNGASSPVHPTTANLPGPPPPTPSSPTDAKQREFNYQNFGPLGLESPPQSTSPLGSATPERRPEKTTAVASRLIAAGLGQRAPKRTPEQREYDQAMKVQEKKKRDQAKAEEERKQREAEAAKKAIWDD
ncbi:hypothetical protein CKM354_000364800 [Cercospora kikuchii]|uniref:Ubiquitin smt3 n=1 Tax=Cercospora kikuchii TaxID=84275 RepID=A0A9P3CKS7_9PEZI|nr:uncharacterized protein CKM354_000364800 [Cercospora kikuchii]GIZ40303.1 hypothetical protein CKM354_000364800 [Cercospora kikuchii]